MKDAKDPGTMELLEAEPYLVVMNTKKGFREFMTTPPYTGWRVHWNKNMKYARTFEVTELTKLLEWAFPKRCVTVGVVIGREITVLSQTKVPFSAGR